MSVRMRTKAHRVMRRTRRKFAVMRRTRRKSAVMRRSCRRTELYRKRTRGGSDENMWSGNWEDTLKNFETYYQDELLPRGMRHMSVYLRGKQGKLYVSPELVTYKEILEWLATIDVFSKEPTLRTFDVRPE